MGEQLVGHERSHGGAPLGIAHGGHVAGGLVQQERGVLLGQRDGRAIHGHHVRSRINLHAHLGHPRAVHGHATSRDQFLGMAPRGHPGPGQKLLQPHFGHGGDLLVVGLEDEGVEVDLVDDA